MNCRISSKVKEAKVINFQVSVYKQKGTKVRHYSCDYLAREDSNCDDLKEQKAQFIFGIAQASHIQILVNIYLRVCVGTWNVGGKLPPDDLDIDDWLGINELADIYVLR